MRDIVKVFICCVVLFSLTACGMLSQFHEYTEPSSGPRAKIRTIRGVETRIYPGETCFNDKNEMAGHVGLGFNPFASNKSLDMPMKPDRAGFDEHYVPADVPVTIYFYHFRNVVYNNQNISRHCGPLGFTFTPKEGENYEADSDLNDKTLTCTYTLEQIVKDAAGTYKKQRMTPSQVSSCR